MFALSAQCAAGTDDTLTEAGLRSLRWATAQRCDALRLLTSDFADYADVVAYAAASH